jgi:hypothetical protein
VFSTSALDRDERSASLFGYFIPGERARCPFCKTLGGALSQSGRFKVKFAAVGNQVPLVQPVLRRHTGCCFDLHIKINENLCFNLQVRICVPLWSRIFPSQRCPDRPGANPASYPMGTGGFNPLKVTAHLQPIPKSRKLGSIHPLPHVLMT